MDDRSRRASLSNSLHYPDLRAQIVGPARLLAWSLAVAIVGLSVVPPDLRPVTPLPHDLEHLEIFWAAGFAFALGHSYGNARLPTLLVIFTAAVEVTQLFVPGRHARLTDFFVDAAAICIGVISVLLMDRICAPRTG